MDITIIDLLAEAMDKTLDKLHQYIIENPSDDGPNIIKLPRDVYSKLESYCVLRGTSKPADGEVVTFCGIRIQVLDGYRGFECIGFE